MKILNFEVRARNIYFPIFPEYSTNALKDWSPYITRNYDPLKAGSIDGTDTEPHDKAISRAIESHYEPPRGLKSKPERTVFVSRFGPETTENDLKQHFSSCGEVESVTVIRDIVTGISQCYGFVEMETQDEARKVIRRLHGSSLKGHTIFVDFEFSRSIQGWKPRRLGGGLGGKKESGQLRFGGKERRFKRPIITETRKYNS